MTNIIDTPTTESVKTLSGFNLDMQLIKTYTNGKLFFCQERLCMTDLDNNEITSLDVIHHLDDIL